VVKVLITARFRLAAPGNDTPLPRPIRRPRPLARRGLLPETFGSEFSDTESGMPGIRRNPVRTGPGTKRGGGDAVPRRSSRKPHGCRQHDNALAAPYDAVSGRVRSANEATLTQRAPSALDHAGNKSDARSTTAATSNLDRLSSASGIEHATMAKGGEKLALLTRMSGTTPRQPHLIEQGRRSSSLRDIAGKNVRPARVLTQGRGTVRPAGHEYPGNRGERIPWRTPRRFPTTRR